MLNIKDTSTLLSYIRKTDYKNYPNCKLLQNNFTPLDKWQENAYIEELRKADDLSSELAKFEKERLSEEIGGDAHLIIDRNIGHAKHFEIVSGLSGTYQEFYFTRCADLIGDLTLNVKYKDLDFDPNNRFDLLSMPVILRVNGSEFSSFTVSSNIMLCGLRNKYVLEEEGIIKIPLLCLDIPPDNLFPIVALPYSSIGIIIKPTEHLSKNVTFTISYTGYYIDTRIVGNSLAAQQVFGEMLGNTHHKTFKAKDQRRTVARTAMTYISLKSHNYKWHKNQDIPICGKVKFILFYFRLKKANTIWEHIGSQPVLECVKMSVSKLAPIEFRDVITTVDFMGIRMFLVPLIPEFASLELVKDQLEKGKFTADAINFFKLQDVVFDLEIDQPIEEYDVSIIAINITNDRIGGGVLRN